MKPLLTILRDPARAGTYASLAGSAGVSLVQADGALHALTQLERTQVSAIICEADMGDMGGAEFRSVVHAENQTSGVPVFILPDPQVLAGESLLQAPAPSGPEVLRQALQVCGVSPEALPVPMNSALAAQLQGDLEQFQLGDLLGWVAEMRLSGHWLVTVEDRAGDRRSAHLVMSGGDLTYGEYSGLVGKNAVFALLQAIARLPRTTFAFYKTSQIPAVRCGNLHQTTARLLIELAVDIDHSGAAHYH